ncbi:MAG: hypothetical protein AABX11_07690 [Nanoarchaeota archaeon]
MVSKKEDYIGELAGYIKKNLKKGYTSDSLKYALINQGHSRLEVEKAIARAQTEQAREAPVLKTTPNITYEVLDSNDKEVKVEEKKSFWKRLIGL